MRNKDIADNPSVQASNAERAAEALAIADSAMTCRKAALCAHVALSTTRTTAAARRTLREWDGSTTIRDAAILIIDSLTATDDGDVHGARGVLIEGRAQAWVGPTLA